MKKLLLICLTLLLSCSFISCSNTPVNENITGVSQTVTQAEITEPTTAETTTQGFLRLTDVTGKTLDTAKATLESIGFVVEMKEEFDDTVPNGNVIRQMPAPENNLNLKKGDVVTLIVSKGKPVSTKVYLDTMPYAEFINESPMNTFSAFTGQDCHGNECTRAVKFCIDSNKEEYSEDMQATGQAVYKIYYKLDKKYKNLYSELTSGNNFSTVNIKIYADDTMIYGMGVTKDTEPIPLNIDVSETDMLTIEISVAFYKWSQDDYACNIILNNAYFK